MISRVPSATSTACTDMSTPRILALDISSHLGFARYANGVIDHGAVELANKPATKSRPLSHEGAPFLRFSKWLTERLTEDKPEIIVYERAGYFASAAAANMLVGLRGVMFEKAAIYDVPIIAYSPSAIKKFSTGNGASKKPEMLVAAQRMSNGEVFADDNAVDAYLMLCMHLVTTCKPNS